MDLCVHLNVLDITLEQHDEIQRLREDVRQLMPYLSEQGIYTSLNHVASGINGPLTAAHLAAILPWVDGLEVINGTRLVVSEPHGDVPGTGDRQARARRRRFAHRPRHRPDLDRSARRAAPARNSWRACGPAAPMPPAATAASAR